MIISSKLNVNDEILDRRHPKFKSPLAKGRLMHGNNTVPGTKAR